MKTPVLEFAAGFRHFAFDQKKRAKVKSDHGIDPLDAVEALAAESHVRYASPRGEELRHVALVELEGRLIAVAYAERDGVCRLITARATRTGERRAHAALLHLGDP